VAAPVRVPVQLNRVRPREARLTNLDPNTLLAQVVGVFVAADNCLALLHVVHHPAQVGGAAHLQPKAGRLPGLVHLPRRVNERLAGHAAVVEAVAAHVLRRFVN